MSKRLAFAAVLVASLVVGQEHSLHAASVDAEAKEAAKQLWKAVTSRCGDTIIYNGGKLVDSLTQYKGTEFDIQAQKLTEADKLNGIEWAGSVKLRSEARRTLYSSGWTEWLALKDGLSFAIRKTNGIWDYGLSPNNDMFLKYAPISKIIPINPSCEDTVRPDPAADTSSKRRLYTTKSVQYYIELNTDQWNEAIKLDPTQRPSPSLNEGLKKMGSLRSGAIYEPYLKNPDDPRSIAVVFGPAGRWVPVSLYWGGGRILLNADEVIPRLGK
jgi:hypothetical protein